MAFSHKHEGRTPPHGGRDIEAMFDLIAPRYDFLNSLLSFGLDRRWRKQAVKSLRVPDQGWVLDMACGTADIALEAASQHPSAVGFAGVDVSREMLKIARGKIAAAAAGSRIQLVEGNCEAIPLMDDFFDAAVVAFGIRNVTDRLAGLRELKRVLKPGGKMVILEFSHPRPRLFRWLFHFYFHHVLPLIGGLISRRSAYFYLPQSVEAFPQPLLFAALVAEAGFVGVRFRPLTWGVVTLYEADVPGLSGS